MPYSRGLGVFRPRFFQPPKPVWIPTAGAVSQALVATLLTSGSDETDLSAYTTASITPVADRPVFLFVVGVDALGGEAPTSVSGCGLTWTQAAFVVTSTVGLTCLVGVGASPTSGAVTITYNSTQARAIWSITSVENADPTTPVVQAPTGVDASNGTSFAVGLAAFGDALNGVIAAFSGTSGGAVSPGDGYTELDEQLISVFRLETQFRADNDPTPDADWTFSTTGNRSAIAVEIHNVFATAAGTTITVTTPGAVTWTGQSVGLTTSIVASPGGISWAGQAVSLTTKVTPTAGAVSWAGQTVGLKTTITPTPGAVTWAGSSLSLTSSVAASPGAVTWTGQSVDLATALAVAPGAITWAGATDISLAAGGNVTVSVTTPGAVTWTGQAIGLKTSVAVGALAVTWTGSVVGLKTSIAASPGTVLWTGQTVGLKTSLTPTPGAVTWAGATDITLSGTSGTTVNVDVPGAVTWTGQQAGLRVSIAASAGAVTWTGQTVGLLKTIPVTPGALTWAGQQVALRTLIGLSPGAVTWTGQDVTVIDSGSVFNLFDELAVGPPEARWRASLVRGTWTVSPPSAKWRAGKPDTKWDADPPAGRWVSLRSP